MASRPPRCPANHSPGQTAIPGYLLYRRYLVLCVVAQPLLSFRTAAECRHLKIQTADPMLSTPRCREYCRPRPESLGVDVCKVRLQRHENVPAVRHPSLRHAALVPQRLIPAPRYHWSADINPPIAI